MIKIAFYTNAVIIGVKVTIKTTNLCIFADISNEASNIIQEDCIAHGGHLFPATIHNSGEEELFDPSQIFCSPSIKYCELLQYAKQSVYSIVGKRHLVQIAFQVRLCP